MATKTVSPNRQNAIFFPTVGVPTTLGFAQPYSSSTKTMAGVETNYQFNLNACFPCILALKTVLDGIVTYISNNKNNDTMTTTKTVHDFLSSPSASGYPWSWYEYIKSKCIRLFFMHPGLDLGAQQEDPIFSVAWGKVLKKESKEQAGFNGLLVIEHKVKCGKDVTTFYARYAHLDYKKITVNVNDIVYPGQVICTGVHDRDTVGSPSGDHLHFEISTTNIYSSNAGIWWSKDKNSYAQINLFKYFCSDMVFGSDAGLAYNIANYLQYNININNNDYVTANPLPTTNWLKDIKAGSTHIVPKDSLETNVYEALFLNINSNGEQLSNFLSPKDANNKGRIQEAQIHAALASAIQLVKYYDSNNSNNPLPIFPIPIYTPYEYGTLGTIAYSYTNNGIVSGLRDPNSFLQTIGNRYSLDVSVANQN